MLDSPAGQIAMGGGSFGLKKIRAYAQLISLQKGINKAMIQKQEEVIESEQPDRIAHNGKVIYPVIWGFRNKGKTSLIIPVPNMHYVEGNTHVGFHSNWGTFLNKLSYKIANYGLLKTISSSVKWLKTPESRNIKQKEIQEALFNNQCIYTISPTLFKRPTYWAKNLKVLGYHKRKKTSHWQPSVEIEAFLEKHSKIVFVTFGSMINTRPIKNTQIILDILERNNIPAIINTASGGLVQPENYNKDLFHFVKRIPYDWIFPKMYAVIHHGGSGTTHSTIKNGCASLIIPHIIDQYVWNTMLAKKGAGPLGMDVSKISTKRLEPKILDVINNPDYKSTAQSLGKQMKKEDYREAIFKAIIGEK